MPLSPEVSPAMRESIKRAVARYYSHREADIAEATEFIEETIKLGKVDPSERPIDIINVLLLGARHDAYCTVHALALEILRNPERIRTTSTGEGFAAALIFNRDDWFGAYTWAAAAERVGATWLKVCADP
jgi:hypothetical protein